MSKISSSTVIIIGLIAIVLMARIFVKEVKIWMK